jgi:hypothetical protein
VNNGKPKHIIPVGDFNCPDIDWNNMAINPKAPEKEVQQKFIDLSTEFNLTQVHGTPTREDNLLDIVLTTNATLVKSSTNIDINTIWETFKRKLKAAIDENIPSKIFKRNNNLPWMTKSLRRMVRRKVRLYRAARKSKQWTEYNKHKKKCKKQFHKAEAQYVNNIITEGLEKNDRKPFYRYAKAKKQDNIGIAPLKHKGSMTNDSKEETNILRDRAFNFQGGGVWYFF